MLTKDLLLSGTRRHAKLIDFRQLTRAYDPKCEESDAGLLRSI